MNAHDANPPALRREALGHVWVDSGRLIVADPTYLDQLAEQEGALASGEARCEIVGDGMAVAFQTGPRTGRYPVYVTRFENGCVARIEIELDERASPPR
jgi:hypothetical protein